MRLSGVLAEQTHGGGSAASSPLAAAQQRFYQACRFAEMELATEGADSMGLKSLREQNKELAQRLGFERTRADAERQARAGLLLSDAENAGNPQGDPLPDRGLRLFGPENAGAAPPQIQLEGAGLVQARRNGAMSLVLLCVLMAVAVFSYLPRTWPWLRRCWPEQIALLAWLLWLMNGPPLVVLGLLIAAMVGRVVELGVFAYRASQRVETQPSTAVGSSAS